MVSLVTRENTLRMIVERLRWPVRMVRWRAAQEYGDLIADKVHSKLATSVYLEWLAQRQLETEVLSGLAVLQCTKESSLPDFRTLSAHINSPSILADVVLQSLYGYGRTRGGWEHRHSGTAPDSFQPEKFFLDHKSAHVPPHLSHQLERVVSRSGIPMIKQWAFEWKELMLATKSPYSGYPYYFVDGSDDRRGLNGQFSQRQCDVFRSAFLRTVAFAVQKGMPRTYAAGLAGETCAVNNDFVKLRPRDRPSWLGQLPERCCLPESSLENVCRELLQEARNTGGLFPASLKIPISTEVEKFAELNLTAVLATPDFEPLSEEDAYFKRDFLFLGEQSNFNSVLPDQPVAEMERPGATGKCMLTTFEAWPVPHGFWHNDYFVRGISLPWANILGSPANVKCQARHVEITSNAVEVGAWAVWHDHWSPIHPKDGHGRCGMITTMRDTDLKKTARTYGLKLGWLAELNVWRSETDFGEFQKSRRFSFFFDE